VSLVAAIQASGVLKINTTYQVSVGCFFKSRIFDGA
jgi:hypothetical protein